MIVALPLAETWPHIVGKIEATINRLQVDCSADELFNKCAEGDAFLYGNTEDDAFTIVEPIINSRTQEPELFILLAWGMGMAQKNHTWIFHELAQGLGAKRIRFQSPRRGFVKTGWTVEAYVYTQEVQ